MKTLSKSALLLTLAVGICSSIITTAWSQSQHRGGYGDSAITEAWGPDVVQSFPIESDTPSTEVPYAPESTPTYQTENFSDQNFEQSVVTDELLYPEVREVKNVNFFGVDRNECCDEWSGLGGCKSLKYGGRCGGLKSSKGHLGIGWLRSGYGGEDCDYCNGGCCEKDCGTKLRDLIKSCPIKNCLKKFCCKDSAEEASCSNDEPSQTSIFGRPLNSNCDRCGCCDEGCSPEQGCNSCN